MLRRLCLELARGLEIRDERQMHEARVLGPDLEAELPCRLQEGERLDVAGNAADLAEYDVAVVFASATDRRPRP